MQQSPLPDLLTSGNRQAVSWAWLLDHALPAFTRIGVLLSPYGVRGLDNHLDPLGHAGCKLINDLQMQAGPGKAWGAVNRPVRAAVGWSVFFR